MGRRRQRGFSLLELMIVVAMILAISVIAIPSYLRARQAAYEASAVGFAHSVQADQAAYRATNGSYATSFSQLPGYASAVSGQNSGSSGNTSGGSGSGGNQGTPSAQDIAGSFGSLASSSGTSSSVIRNAYVFTLVNPNNDEWYLTAFPLDDRITGLYVYTDSSGLLKSQKGAPPPIPDSLRAQ